MATYVTPKINTAYECYVSLVSQANTKVLQNSPTMAAGDVKVSTDNGASANITTLPVIGTNTRLLKVNLSAGEMNGGNVSVVFSDVAGAEWCDLTLNIQTSARQIDDLASPTNITAATGVVLSAVTHTGAVIPTVSAITGLTAANLDATVSSRMATYAQPTGFLAATFPAGTVANTTNITAGTMTTTTNLTTNNDKTGYGLSSAAVQAIWDALTTALTTVGSIGKKLADWTIGTTQTGDSFARLGAPAGASVSVDIAAMKVDTAAILVDTIEIGVAGAGLTNINLPNQTMDITGNITGNLSGSVGSLGVTAKSDVNAEVVDALATDTYVEPGQGVPATTTTLAAKINYLYKAFLNKVTQTATTQSIYNNAATVVDQKATVSDDGTTFTRTNIISGP